MKRCIMTVCSDDWYQGYIPIFVWSILNTWDDVDVIVYLRGNLDDVTAHAMLQLKSLDRVCLTFRHKTDYPYLVGTTNALRFTTDCPVSEKIQPYDEVLVTDVDFFFTKASPCLFEWHKELRKLNPNSSYVGHHGPWKYPKRPEICDSWTGRYERISGGFVMLYPDWWNRTKEIRDKWDKTLKSGRWGDFRESDECMLARMIKEAGLPIAPKIAFPRVMRHVHLGDFRENMKHRYTNPSRMRAILDPKCAKSFAQALSDPVLGKIINIVRDEPIMDGVLDRAIEFCVKGKIEN